MFQAIYNIYAQVGLVIYVAVCVTALSFGGRSERLGAAGILVASFLTLMVEDMRFPAMQYGLLVVDSLTAFYFIGLTLVSVRLWPPVVAALQLLAVMFHIGKGVDGNLRSFPYLTAAAAVGYLILIVLLIGTWSAWRERRSHAAMISARPR